MKYIKYLLFLSLALQSFTLAQNLRSNSININSNAVIRIPATEILFTIRLNEKDEDPQKVYDKHKLVEQNLANQLREFGIKDSNVTYTLMNISEVNKYNEKQSVFRTFQEVNVKIEDISDYERFQISLLKNGISDFRASFSAKSDEKVKDRLIEKAISQAKQKAEKIAMEIGKQLTGVLEVNTHMNEIRPQRVSSMKMQGDLGSGLNDIPQFVEFRTNLNIRFGIE